ncbi:MAG: MFS transporter [Tepidisphaerales bacterium]
MPEVLNYESPALTQPPPPRFALLTIFLIVFVDLLGFGIIIPALPVYALRFSASPVQVGLIFSIFSACQFVATPILGAWSDRIGRKPVLVLSQLGSAIGYVLLGLVNQDFWGSGALALMLLYASRIIDGVSGGNISTAQAYIADITSSEKRAKGMGVLGAAFGLGFTLGPPLGGAFGKEHIWLPAYLAAGASCISCLMTLLLLRESRVHRPIDAEAWLHPHTFLPVFRDPVLRSLLLTSFLCMAAFVMMEASLMMFLLDRFQMSFFKAALYLCFLGLVIAAVQGGLIHRMNKRFDEWSLAIWGLVAAAAGMLGYVQADLYPVMFLLFVAGFFNAVGRSMWQPTFQALVSKFTPPDKQGVVFGLYWGMSSMARVIGPIVGTAFYWKNRGLGPFAIAAGLLAVAAVWTRAMRRPLAQSAEPAMAVG